MILSEQRRRGDERIDDLVRSVARIESGLGQNTNIVKELLLEVKITNGRVTKNEKNIELLRMSDTNSGEFELKINRWAEFFTKIVLGAIVLALLSLIIISNK